MDDVLCVKRKRGRHRDFGDLQCPDFFTCRKQFRVAGRLVNMVFRATSANGVLVCGIHDGVGLDFGDIVAYNF